MPLLRGVHHSRVHTRRVSVLAKHLSALLAPNVAVLDVGAGDGLLAQSVLATRPDLRWTAVDTLARPQSYIPVELFDGEHLPYPDKGFDVVLFVDVLHHTDDPMVLLREAARVARSSILIKDHLRNGFLAAPTLRFMDWIGNAAWGVRLPYNYWSADEWERAREVLHLRTGSALRDLKLYPWWADWWFGRSLHMITRFDLRLDARVDDSPLRARASSHADR
jgi:SAM-dependent methyltransferase